MTLKVQNLQKIQGEGNPNVNIIIYGDAGVGKTYLASSSAELGRVLLIDAEAGSQFLPEKYSKNIDVLPLNDVNDLDEVLKVENIKDYNTIVIDSITEVAKKMCDHVRGNKESMAISDWGKVINKLEIYFRRFRDLQKNCVLVALAQEKEDDNVVVKRPALSGKNLPANIIGYQDICVYMSQTKEGRVGYTRPGEKYWAKDRTGKLPEILKGEELTFKFIYEACASKSPVITPEQLKEIKDMVKKMKITDDGWANALKHYGVEDEKKMTQSQYRRMKDALELKLKQVK